MRQREEQRSFRDLRQQRPLLCFAAASRNKAGADHDGGKIRLGHQPAPERLHQDADLDPAAAEPAMLFGNWQRQPAEVGKLLPCRRTEAIGLSRCLAAAIRGVVVADKAVGAFAQQALFVAEGEVHLIASLWPVSVRKSAGPRDPPPFRIPAGYARDKADAAQRPARSPPAGPSRRPSG